MSDHQGALQAMLINWLGADATLQALLGDPAWIWDEPPANPAWPHLLIGRSESRAVAADGCGIEHVLTLNCVSRFGGSEEAKAICAAVWARLNEAALTGGGVRTVSVRVTFSDVFRSGDLRRTYGVMRVRAVTEDI
jgi:hypothetical protein